MIRQPYNRTTVRAVVERCGEQAVPLAFHKWWGEGTYARHGQALDQLTADIPDDVLRVAHVLPGMYESPTADQNYRWAFSSSPPPAGGGMDARPVLPDWRDLDAYLAEFPDPDRQPGIFDPVRAAIAASPDRYTLGHWWFCFYERMWSIRGMQNLLMDFIEHPREVKRLGRAILDYHVKVVRRLAECGVDAILTSDDLGSQRALMMSPAVFRSLLKPLYAEFIAEVHSLGLHFWLHACGNVTAVLEDFVEIGVDVIHPIQAHAMDYREVAGRFGGRISFLLGIDVQHLLPEGSEDEVRSGVREAAAIFRRPEGGLLLAAGNGIMPETPLRNVRAFLEEASRL